jgi:hypothetical protein
LANGGAVLSGGRGTLSEGVGTGGSQLGVLVGIAGGLTYTGRRDLGGSAVAPLPLDADFYHRPPGGFLTVGLGMAVPHVMAHRGLTYQSQTDPVGGDINGSQQSSGVHS